MFGLLDDLASLTGKIVGTTLGIAVAPLAIALGVTESAIREAMSAGCETVEDIKEFLDID